MKQTNKLFCAAVMTIAAMTVLTGRIDAQQTAALVRALGGKAKANGSVVTLNEGVSVRNTVTVPAGVTLDLTADGKLTLQNNATLTVNGTVNANAGRINIEKTAVINGSGTINLKSKGRLLNIQGSGRKLTLDGVTLVGLPNNDDSLVGVNEGGELVLKSGAISGNTATDGGGGVGIWGSTFTMSGGTISGNTVVYSSGGGGGVRVDHGSIFTMSGGAISDNSVIGEVANSGGVCISGSTFTMSGGEIYGNSVQGKVEGSGGGMRIIEGTFIMKGGAIYGNTGSGVFVSNSSTFIMEGGRIQGSEDSDGFAKNTIVVNPGDLVWSALKMNNTCTTKWGTGGTYTKGGAAQTGGSDIVPVDPARSTGTNDTLIAIPKQ